MKKVIVIFATLLLSVLFIRLIFGGNEDTWLCQNGEWVKHGNPNTQKPENGCEIETTETPEKK